jgi:hypothetical protein
LPLQQWLQSRTEAAYYVVGDVQIARIVFTIGAVVAFCYLILACTRRTRFDSQASLMQNEQSRRTINLFVTFCALFFAAFSYGVDSWGGDCDSDHVVTIFMLQRLASTCCVISYLLEGKFTLFDFDIFHFDNLRSSHILIFFNSVFFSLLLFSFFF